MNSRTGLIEMYTDQLKTAGPFMTAVLKEAVRKLRDTDEKRLPRKKIENWVIRLEKDFRTI